MKLSPFDWGNCQYYVYCSSLGARWIWSIGRMRTDMENKLQSKTRPTAILSTKNPSRTIDRGNKTNSNFILFFFPCMYFIQDECFRVRTDVWVGGVKNAYQTWGMWARNTTLHLCHTKAGKVTCSECHARSPPFLLAAICSSPSQQPGHLEIMWVKYSTNTHSASTRKSNFKMAALIVCASEEREIL